MSRIGKIPVPVPSGVQVRLEGRVLKAKGPQGELEERLPDTVQAAVADGKITLTADARSSRDIRMSYGTTRARVANMVHGVHTGFKRAMEIVGLGFKAQLAGDKLTLSLGKSHPVEFRVPKGVKTTVDPKSTLVTFSAASKELVGATAAAFRQLREPEPYKGTGIRHQGEHIQRKAGKTAAGVGAGAGGGAKK